MFVAHLERAAADPAQYLRQVARQYVDKPIPIAIGSVEFAQHPLERQLVLEHACLVWLDQFGEVREQMIERTAMRRNGRVADIALACLYFASPASSWVTGKILEVDGMAQHELIDKHLADL